MEKKIRSQERNILELEEKLEKVWCSMCVYMCNHVHTPLLHNYTVKEEIQSRCVHVTFNSYSYRFFRRDSCIFYSVIFDYGVKRVFF